LPKFPDVSHLEAIRAFEKAGFYIKRQSKQVIMTNDFRVITIPREKPH
jgi:predicted RNA binding protein YcfA (HicA-like mRNA interferase family)